MSQRITLADILSRMNRWDEISTEEEQFQVRDLDEAIRKMRRKMPLPWTLQQTTLRVFDDVLIYPTPSDQDEMAFFDNDKKAFGSKPRLRRTTIKEFFEDIDNRNDLTEVWDNNERLLGVRYKTRDTSSVRLNNAEVASEWTASQDADSVALDKVNFKEGNGSIKVVVTNSSGTATIKNTITSQNDGNYKQKYQFKLVYLAAVPTSITLRYHVSASIYLETTGITTQFSGQALKANDWNLVAQDLNTATATGTVPASPTFTYEEIDLVGATTGTYWIDASYVRQWELLDYWYYSNLMIALVGETTANQQYFFNSSGVYSTDSQLVGDSEWADVIMFEALKKSAINAENNVLIEQFRQDRNDAISKIVKDYPSEVPVTISHSWRFRSNNGGYGRANNENYA